MRDVQNTQCLLNVEHVGSSCPHVTLQFTDSKGDVGLGLVKEGLVMVEPRKEKQFQKVVRERRGPQQLASEGSGRRREGSGTLRRASRHPPLRLPFSPADHRIPKCTGDSQECPGRSTSGSWNLGAVPGDGGRGVSQARRDSCFSPALSLQLNLWRYGDFRADDADEFGYSR